MHACGAGHGSQKRDFSGDEKDGMNETLCPTDFERAGQIVDDELNRRLVNPLPTGVRLHALLDACHSGTGLDLPYVTKMDKASGKMFWQHEGPTRCAATWATSPPCCSTSPAPLHLFVAATALSL
jgi:metacaspase-1